MLNDMTVSRQWASRPMDQRFLTIDELYEKVASRKASSATANVALDMMQVSAVDGEIILTGKKTGRTAALTHWSFGQLCSRAKAPAGYLRTLPADLAVMPLQWSLEMHEATSDEGNDASLLFRKNGDLRVASVNSPTYGRIWDEQVVRTIKENVDPNLWKVPGASYQNTDPRRATTLYASDRDVFIFLVNEGREIEVDGERINRGFYCWNSEVGSATFGIATFTYDFVCDNRIIWGQKNFKELTIRHTAGGPMRFMQSATPQLVEYAQSSALGMIDIIKRAKATEVGKDRESVLQWMKSRGFTVPQARKAYDAAEADKRGYNPRSVWGLVQGATDVAHDTQFTDARTEIERKAGALLEALEE